MGAFIWACTPGAIDRMVSDIDRELLAYIGRYTGFGLDELDAKSVARLKRLADGVSKILTEENKT